MNFHEELEMSAQVRENDVPGKASKKRPYPGAKLRYLGSVRDVTLAKTRTPGDGVSTRRQGA